MQLPLQIAYQNLPGSPSLDARIRDKAERLDEFCDHIMGCRVVVEVPHKHHAHGNQYQVRIDITVPGEEIVISREPPERVQYRDIEVALRDAFDAAARQMEDYVRRTRGFTKAHAGALHAKVSKLFPEEGYGFLETPDGKEVYFHRHSVLHEGFGRLQIGTEVTFAEEMGKKGLQASTVKPVRRHHHL